MDNRRLEVFKKRFLLLGSNKAISKSISVFSSLLYASNFNARHVDWGYNDNSADGSAWLAGQVLLVFPPIQCQRCCEFLLWPWNTGTNPNLAFASVSCYTCLHYKHVLKKLHRTQHQPSLIKLPRLVL